MATESITITLRAKEGVDIESAYYQLQTMIDLCGLEEED
jgi:hypothetical protein